MAILDSVDWTSVKGHYDERVQVSNQMVDLHRQGQGAKAKFADLALGISDRTANYSAVEHGLGPRILASNANADSRIHDLATKFMELKNAFTVPELIKKAQIKYLQIGVGSELSCMVNPSINWVANSRTIWLNLVIKHADDIEKADDELKLYREADVTSEMAYAMWSEIHAELKVSLTRVRDLSISQAAKAGVPIGNLIYLWADAIANRLYETYHVAK